MTERNSLQPIENALVSAKGQQKILTKALLQEKLATLPYKSVYVIIHIAEVAFMQPVMLPRSWKSHCPENFPGWEYCNTAELNHIDPA